MPFLLKLSFKNIFMEQMVVMSESSLLLPLVYSGSKRHLNSQGSIKMAGGGREGEKERMSEIEEQGGRERRGERERADWRAGKAGEEGF